VIEMAMNMNFLSGCNINFRTKSFYLDFFFLFVCVWTLLSVGSDIQYYLFKFIGSDSSTLYGSAFEDAVAKIPTLNGYLSGAYSITSNYNFLAAFFIVFCALFFQVAIHIFIVCIVSSVIALTTTDLVFYFFTNSLTLKTAVECIMANIIGSPFIAAFVIMLFYIKKKLFELSGMNNVLCFMATYVCYSLVSFMVLIVGYYTVCYFYRPTSINFSVSTSQQFSGDYFIINKKSDINKKVVREKRTLFSLMGNPVEIKKGFEISGGVNSIRSHFNDDKSYKISLYPLLNCLDEHAINVRSYKPLIFKNVKKFHLKLSESLSMIRLNDNSGYVKSSNGIVNTFDVKNNKNNMYEITKVNKGTITYYPSDADGGFFIGNPVIEFSEGQVKRNINYEFNINGEEKVITLKSERLRSSNQDKPLVCKVSPFDFHEKNITIEAGESVYVGLLMKIEPESKDEYFSIVNHSSNGIDISGGVLHFQASDVPQVKFLSDYVEDGYIDGFILHSFDKLSFDGKSVDSSKMDNLMVTGDDIYASISSGNNLVINGRASLFYKNNLRQNKTLWESSSDNTIILGGVGAILTAFLLWCLKKISSALTSNDNINLF
jgi:hypothetical protein